MPWGCSEISKVVFPLDVFFDFFRTAPNETPTFESENDRGGGSYPIARQGTGRGRSILIRSRNGGGGEELVFNANAPSECCSFPPALPQHTQHNFNDPRGHAMSNIIPSHVKKNKLIVSPAASIALLSF